MTLPDDPATPPPPAAPRGRDEADQRVIPVIEEEAVISRMAEETGKAVRVRIETREERQLIPLADMVEEVVIERVPINRYVSERTGPREEGDVVIIPVFETLAVIEQHLVLKEEIRIVRHRRAVPREEEVILRKETPVIESRAPDREEWREEPPER